MTVVSQMSTARSESSEASSATQISGSKSARKVEPDARHLTFLKGQQLINCSCTMVSCCNDICKPRFHLKIFRRILLIINYSMLVQYPCIGQRSLLCIWLLSLTELVLNHAMSITWREPIFTHHVPSCNIPFTEMTHVASLDVLCLTTLFNLHPFTWNCMTLCSPWVVFTARSSSSSP